MTWSVYIFLGFIVLTIGLIIHLFIKFWEGLFISFIDGIMESMDGSNIKKGE